jgi:hypothetical protein
MHVADKGLRTLDKPAQPVMQPPLLTRQPQRLAIEEEEPL